MISSDEALHFLSQVRLAVEMNLMTGIPLEALNELFLLTLPAHLQTIEDRVMSTTERNEVRAKHIRQRLSTG
jgi:protein arginine kinase